MQLLPVDFSFKAVWLLTVHRGSHLRARDEPSSDHIRHGEAITTGPFLVTVCSPNDKPTGCALVLGVFVCLPPQWNFLEVFRWRWECRQTESQTHQGHSSVTVTKQYITPARYTVSLHHAERYTWGLSYCPQAALHQDPQMAHSEQTQTGLSLPCQRDELLYSSSVCTIDLFNHVESWKNA